MTNLSTFRNALQAFDVNHMTPYAVGFDRTFDRLFDYVTHQAESTGYPPYNIEKQGDYNFTIEMALAGFGKKDIEIEFAEGLLTVQSVKEKEEKEKLIVKLNNSEGLFKKQLEDKKTYAKELEKRIRNNFIAGVVVLIPIGITLYLTLFFIKISGNIIPKEINPNNYLPFNIPGVEIVITIFFITLVGGLSLSFFGKTAYTATSVAQMAIKYDALLIPFFAERQSDGFNFKLHFDKPIVHSKPEKMTQQLNDLLEQRVRTKMDQWLWTHQRWKKPKN